MEILNNKIFKSHLNLIHKLGINSHKIIKIKQKYIVNNCKMFNNNKIFLRGQVDHSKRREDNFLIQIKVLIGIIKI